MDSLDNIANGVTVAVLTGARTLTPSDAIVCRFDGGGVHRDVTLDGPTSPGTTAGRSGATRVVVNAGATNNLVVKDPAGSTLATLAPSREGLFMTNAATGAWTHVRTVATV
jgi:hypothetical protein